MSTVITRKETATVGPLGGSYVYRLGNHVSVPYANAASARHAGKAPEHALRSDGRLEPVW